MRGTPWHGYASGNPSGIIPAYAGNTLEQSLGRRFVGDHPRVCGEHMVKPVTVCVTTGSSPRMRGTLRDVRPAHVTHGIIPAYAGNTSPPTKRTARARDHPRVCGEHRFNHLNLDSAIGSSPRMRGTLRHRRRTATIRGIIPAYAGNTLRDYSNFVVSKFMSFVFHLV